MYDDKNGHVYPTPITIKLFIAKAIYKHTMDCLDRNAPSNEMFPVDAQRTLDAAIDRAVAEWDRCGMFAGFKETEDA